MPSPQRDLASDQLWQRSLERSRRRRELAPLVRKTASRRKRLSLAVSAAVAAAPTAPSLAFGGSSGGPSASGNSAAALPLVDRHTDPILLHLGTTSPSVAQVQRELHITVDGIFGRQTQAAVRTFQQEHGLPATGSVDVKTWLTLFPNDTVIATPHGWSASTYSGGPTVKDAVNVTSAGAPSQAQDVSTGAAVHAAGASQASAGSNGGVQAATSAAATAGNPSGSPAGIDPAPALGGGGGAPAVTPGPSVPAPSPGGDSSGSGGSQPSVGGPTPQVTAHPQGSAAQLISTMIAAANRITAHHYAYSWGGGHNPSFSGPYDCSGAVSAVLHAAGLLTSPMVSGDFVHWGAPGPGAVTIYANATHVYMSIMGHFFGTSGSNPGGGAAWYNGAPRAGFAVVHVPFERMHLRPTVGVRAASATRLRVRRSSHVNTSNTTYASDGGTPAPSSGATASSAGTASQRQASDQPTYDQAPPPSPPPSSGSQSSSTAPSGGSQSSNTVAASESAPAPVPASAPAATTVQSESSVASTAAPAPAPAPDPAPGPAPAPAPAVHAGASAPASGGTEAGGPGVGGGGASEQSSHVTVSSDAGTSAFDSAPKAPSGPAGGGPGASGGPSLGHPQGGGSGGGVVKASDG